MHIDPDTVRANTVLSALIYMMTMYQRTPSRQLALNISHHLECIARHPQIDAVIRHIAEGMCEEWELTAGTVERVPAAALPHMVN